MNFRRHLLSIGLLALLIPTATINLRAESTPAATAQRLCDVLLDAMKQGPKLGYDGRLQLLSPTITDVLDLPLMTRLVVGPRWSTLTAAERDELVGAFTAYSLSNYANRFSDYSGEKFTVDPAVTRLERGDVIVHTRLIPHDGEPVQLDYLMRDTGGKWKIIDVFLNGTISELATKRSEYSATLRQSGAAGLAGLLRKKAQAEEPGK